MRKFCTLLTIAITFFMNAGIAQPTSCPTGSDVANNFVFVSVDQINDTLFNINSDVSKLNDQYWEMTTYDVVAPFKGAAESEANSALYAKLLFLSSSSILNDGDGKGDYCLYSIMITDLEKGYKTLYKTKLYVLNYPAKQLNT